MERTATIIKEIDAEGIKEIARIQAEGKKNATILAAEANAKNLGADTQKLIIKSVQVNKGTVIKRFMPRARGSASAIKKRNSHITVELGLK